MSMRPLLHALAAVLATCMSPSASASESNDVASCYTANKLPLPASTVARDVTVLIDQTTLFDETLRRSVLENTWNLVGPNTAFTVVAFSAFSQGRYTAVVAAGRVEPPLPDKQRDSTGERLLASLDRCLVGQLGWAKKHATDAVGVSLATASADLAKSDILAALKDVSARVKASNATDKLVFVASDMLENSSVSSFYASSTKARAIDPEREWAAVQKADLFANFGGARVIVLGAGLIGPGSNGTATYRSPQTMAALRQFWAGYFDRSHATLQDFGQPALLQPVH